MAPELRIRLAVAGLLGCLGVAAVAAGLGFVADPDGSGIGIPQEWLAGSPFATYRVPGAILALMGALSLASAWLQLRARPAAPWWSGTAASGYVIWIVAQAAWMGSFRHPMQTILQALVLLAAIATGLLSLRQLRERSARRAPAA